MKKLVGLLLVAIAGGAMALGLYKLIEPRKQVYSTQPVTIPVKQTSVIAAAPMNLPDFEAAAANSVHAVVHIKTVFQRKSLVYDDFFEFFNFRPQPRERVFPYEAMGSGVIISPEGYIVTNNHVVQDANDIIVTLNDRRVFSATIVGTDPSTDLALIRIDETGLDFLAFGNSDHLKIGEWVLAVGNPFNLTSTVTAGIVSAKARNINILGSQGAIESFIQTDAAVNPGNSGGALVNTQGELIGINAAIASGTGYYTGYSFAIPVNIVRKVVDDLMKYGAIQRAYLGIYYHEMDDQFSKDKGLETPQGIYIEEIVTGGAAEKAGIKAGDILIGMGNRKVTSKSELTEFIGQHNPGDQVDLEILRDGKSIIIQVTLQNETTQTALVQNDKISILGATFEPLTTGEREKLRIDYGYKITQLNKGKLMNAGIREGFILLAVDRKIIRSAQDLQNAFSGNNGGVLLEGMYPNGLRAYYGVGL